MARIVLSPRAILGRRWRQLLALLRARRTGRVVPFRRRRPRDRIEVTERTAFNWHCYLPGVGLVSATATGSTAPTTQGQRFNPAKLLIDPYAKGHRRTSRLPDGDGPPLRPRRRRRRPRNRRTPTMPSRDPEVRRRRRDLRLGRRPPPESAVARHRHLRNPRQGLHEDAIPGSRGLRGTYAGLASDDRDRTLTSLGVTAVELLPVHHIADEHTSSNAAHQLLGLQLDRLLRTRTPPTPPPGTTANRSASSKGMVKALHRANIEVIMDVVYNHTAEGNHLGPMFSFRGIDNASYYRLSPEKPRYYVDYTGTGNSLNPDAPERAAPHHGLASLLRDRVPRRRVPLRPRRGAGPRIPRGRPAVGLFRHHSSGPGACHS